MTDDDLLYPPDMAKTLACSTVASNGIKGDSIFAPDCFWVDDCRTRDSCYWARFHQLDKPVKPKPVGVPGQGDLFGWTPE